MRATRAAEEEEEEETERRGKGFSGEMRLLLRAASDATAAELCAAGGG